MEMRKCLRGVRGILLVILAVTNLTSSRRNVEDAIALLTNDVQGECSRNIGRNHVEITEKDLNSLRIEFIKAQILKKLQMEQTPQIQNPLGVLPVQMRLNPVKATPDVRPVKEELYATTSQVMLLANSGHSVHCEIEAKPSNCFSFSLPLDLTSGEVNSTEFWIYKQHDIMDNDVNTNQTFVYSEIVNSKEIELRRHSTKVENGWIKMNFNREVKRWLDTKNFAPMLKVTCITCGYVKPFTPLDIDTNRPLIIINYEMNMKKKRPKRNINCMSGVTECCREKLYVNFKDIGWDDWVLEPRGYDAYFCKGSCSGATSATLSNTVHNTILRKLSGHNKKLGPVPCCVATEHSPITLIYRHDNQTVTRTTLHNMVVETCGCM